MMNIAVYAIGISFDHHFTYRVLHHALQSVFGAVSHAHPPVITVDIQSFWPGYFRQACLQRCVFEYPSATGGRGQ